MLDKFLKYAEYDLVDRLLTVLESTLFNTEQASSYLVANVNPIKTSV